MNSVKAGKCVLQNQYNNTQAAIKL